MHIKIHSIYKACSQCSEEKTLYILLSKLIQSVYLKERTVFIWRPTLVGLLHNQDEAFWSTVKQRLINCSG